MVVEEPGDLFDDELSTGSYQSDYSGFESFRSFGGIFHNQYWFTETGSFFLNAAGICQDKV